MTSAIARRVFRVRGTVQGVGFRPFVYRVAMELGLRGAVWNDPDGVIVDAEGDPAALDDLGRRLRSTPPPRAVIERVDRPAAAAGWEVTVSAGKVFPFYNQAFAYDPGPLAAPIPGATLEQRGVFTLDARGGLALNLAVARALGRHAALEARLDTADVSVETIGARYHLRANLPAPLPPLSTDVDLGTGTVDLERLRPLSLDLRLEAGARPRVALSAGVSWLPAFRFAVNQGIGIGLPATSGARLSLDVATVALRAEALPSDRGQGRLGGNAGLQVDVPIGPRAAIVLGGRYFLFQKQTLHWGRAQTSGPLPAIQESLVRQVESRLEPVVFNPTFFHASLGIALRF